MVKNNPIQAILNQGYRITSDPTKQPGGFGRRELYAYGKNVDSYCGGAHNAFDFAKYHNAPFKAFTDCTVLRGTGWNTFGWTGVFGFVDHNGHARQFIIGHLNGNPLRFLKVGQKIKKGQTIGYQGTSNNLNVSMASHIHIQFQNYESLGEWAFTCKGLNAYNIDITTSRATGSGSSTKKQSKPAKTSQWSNKYTPRPKRSKAYFKARVKSTNGKGAALRKYSSGRYNIPHGADLPDGSIVYVFQVMNNGFARVYSSRNNGFVHLDQVEVIEMY